MIKNKNFKYIYGPVSSWRLGASLGIDPLSQDEKICSFDCIYCQVGETDILTLERSVFVETESILSEVGSLPDVDIDYVTFSGRGEPTLAANLGEIISGVKKIKNKPVAVITNATLLNRGDVKNDLSGCDFVIGKLDAFDENSFKQINKAHPNASFLSVVESIKEFKNIYRGKLGIQIMFVSENAEHAREIADIVEEIKPYQVQLNTPLRPCGVSPLTEDEMFNIKKFFKESNVISVYEANKKNIEPLSQDETFKRRGKIC
ncbi:MAG: radical SAM protein [Candidatus Saelkia tenebricola]|nr:radical SAM protein [Candidatus Saelkia tenebricola]